MVAIVVVDVQKGFCEGGNLAVAGGNAVAEEIAEFLGSCEEDPLGLEGVFFTRDWHNPWPDSNGGHFSESPDFIDSWPVHCEADSVDAEFHPAIAPFVSDEMVFSKGQGKPDYSGYQGVNPQGKTLSEALHEFGSEQVLVVGLAGDYCVRQTALSLIEDGFIPLMIPTMIASVGGNEATERVIKEIDRLVEW